MRRLALSLLLLAAARLPAQADKGIGIVESASRKYEALSSFQAQFRQHWDDKVPLGAEESRGTIYQEGKNRLAMRWSDPPKEAIILDGTWLWLYLPSTSPGEVKRYPQQNHPTYGSNVVGSFLDNPVDRYRITYLKSERIDGNVTDAVLMEPLPNSGLQFRRATVWFDRELGLPRRLEIEESRDHSRVLELSSFQLNRSIPPSIFTFDPKGLRIISQ
jgi:outer membrane lipoprotein-sorting protein